MAMLNSAWLNNTLSRQAPTCLSYWRARSCRGKLVTCDASRVRHSSLLRNIQTESNHETPIIFQSTSPSPFHNLAIEHFLLTKSHPSSHILLFYTNRPCVVIGRNQNPWSECNLRAILRGSEHGPIDVVRRRSGGGTVFHDIGNLNFSVLVPNDSSFSRRKHAEMVVRALQKDTLDSHIGKRFNNVWVNDRHDITMSKQVDGQTLHFKVSGSAFKLTRGRALHHGTLLHSSPNLKKISGLLASPGRQHIQAKGVESVRSPVSNLFDVEEAQINDLRETITKEICNEFIRLYGEARFVEIDEDGATTSTVADGIDELISNAWRYGQTPRFAFKSPIVQGQQMCMSVNHGLIEECSVQALQGTNLLDVKQWSKYTAPGLANFLNEIFPSIPDTHEKIDPPHGKTTEHSSHITREHPDGTVEIEQGENTIKQR